MGMIKRAADLVYTFRFLTLLVTPFEKTEAFKLGILDKNGKKLKKAGFKVTESNFINELEPKLVERYALPIGEIVYFCEK